MLTLRDRWDESGMIDTTKSRSGMSLGPIYAPARHRTIDAQYAEALLAAQAQLIETARPSSQHQVLPDEPNAIAGDAPRDVTRQS